MKTGKYTLVLGILFAMATAAQAYEWNQTRVWAYAYNNTWQPMYCSGELRGQTASGRWVRQWFNFALWGGQNFTPYIHTNIGDPFVSAGGGINCHF